MDNLELIAVSFATAAITIPIFAMSGATLLNAHEEYISQREKGYKPSLVKAFTDSCKFSWAYLKSFGRTNTSNYDFDACSKEDVK